ncbi:YceH family protein [Parachitinimonas caeni]|uniref:YceH family protein n=1 Tax=Parachitinimonas caeni TaxID=3031301 RepID=A0ABT7E1K2_9NEIS|nr:YceH family protein [Parachitinimonas caeni]MDK2126195.1 YceH family protein [Parachitinimonas caeni]
MPYDLSLVEARILGVLSEKQKTVPDTYPLSLNALLSGCNQKTSRDPVLELSEAEVLSALDALKSRTLIMESSGGRVTRYGHNMDRVLQIPSQSVAILTVLLLRGPQTAGELRLNCDRMHRFADISAVEAFLYELSERSAGALVVELPRQAGARENRWAHLLSGEPAIERSSSPLVATGIGANQSALEARVAALEEEVAELKARLADLLN